MLFSSKPKHGEPTIHGDDLAGDVAGGGQAQEGGEAGDFVGFGDAAEWCVVQDFIQVICIRQFGCGAAGFGVPRGNGVDADAFGRPFAGQVFGELVHGGFAHAVHRAGAYVVQAGDGTNIDDAWVGALSQQWMRELAEVKAAH